MSTCRRSPDYCRLPDGHAGNCFNAQGLLGSEPARRRYPAGFASPAPETAPGRCIACEHYTPKIVGDHWMDDRGNCEAGPDGRVGLVGSNDGCSAFALTKYHYLRAIHDRGYPE